MRKGLIRGIGVSRASPTDIADFLAADAVHDLGSRPARRREEEAHGRLFCGNTELCRITEDLVFTDPYRECADSIAGPARSSTHGSGAFEPTAPLKARGAGAANCKFLSAGAGADPRRPAYRLDHGDRPPTRGSSIRNSPSTARWASMSAPLSAICCSPIFAQERPRGQAPARATTIATGSWRPSSRSGPCSTGRFRALWNGRHASEAFAPGLFADGAGRRRSSRGAGRLHAPPVRRCAGLRRAAR